MDLGHYALRMLLVLPLVCGLVVAALWLARRVPALGGAGALARGGSVRVAEVTGLAPGVRLAVIEFAGRRLLVSVAKTGVTWLGDAPEAGETGRPMAFEALMERAGG